jgi:hypothetical protein
MSVATCPDCGARNAERAPWCTQCYQPLTGPRQHDPATPAGPLPGAREGSASAAAPSSPGGAVPAVGQHSAPGPQAARHEGRDVRQDEHGRVEWRCGTCEAWSPLERPTCVVCGGARRGFGEDEPAEPLDERRLVLLTSLLPGLGHLRTGRVGSGVARALFAVGWLLGGLLLLVAAVRAGSGVWAAVPLLAGGAAVWVLSILDARSLARGGQRERLDGRTLLWLMVGVTCLLVVALLLDAWRLAG